MLLHQAFQRGGRLLWLQSRPFGDHLEETPIARRWPNDREENAALGFTEALPDETGGDGITHRTFELLARFHIVTPRLLHSPPLGEGA